MHELIQPPNKVNIPEEWDFPGKDICSVVQIDVPLGFLSVSSPANPRIDKGDTAYKGEYADYYFGPRGKPSDYLRHTAFDNFSRIRDDGLNLQFSIHEWQGPIEHAALDLTFEQLFSKESRIPLNSLGQIRYESRFHRGLPSATLDTLLFGRSFHSLERELNAPDVLLGLRFGTEGLTPEEWEINRFSANDYEIVSLGEKTFVGFMKGSSLTHTFQWDIVDGVLVAKQFELSSEITKTMEAPLAVDMRRVGEAIFQRGPYPRDENGFYDIPWMNLRNIVSARLAYEQPIEKAPEEG